MKTLVRNSTHLSGKSHDMIIGEIKGKKIKLTYRSQNASEECYAEFFDGSQWNHILCMLDLGVTPDSCSYIWDNSIRKKRADDLFKKAESICAILLK